MQDSLLIIISFFTSMLTAIIGIGGGTLLIAAMPGLYPNSSIVPIHGVVQLASNVSRALFGWKNIIWRFFYQFVLGTLLGMFLGLLLLPKIHWDYLPIILGVSIIIFTLNPKVFRISNIPGKFFILGIIQAFSSLFIGIAGPLSTPFLLQENLSRDQLVVTQAIFSSVTHFFKVIVFCFLGFAFFSHLYLILSMVFSTTIGSLAGTQLRPYLSETIFRMIFRILITILSIRMILKVII